MRSKRLLDSFTNYCQQNPDLRFWQALCNWSGWRHILVSNDGGKKCEDTYYWVTNKRYNK